MKTIDHALELRGTIFGAFEMAEHESDPVARRRWLTFVVVGAGPTGVELVGQLAELLRRSLRRNFRHIDPADARVLLLDAGARHTLVRAEDLAAAAARRSSDLLILDLAVPRNVEPAARTLAKVKLLDLDDLQRGYCPAAGHPSIAVAEAQRLIEDELARLEASLQARAAAPRLAQLHGLGVQLAREEADRALARLDHLSDGERQIVRDMGERLVRRMLYPVSRELRAALPIPPEGARLTA